MIERDPVVHAAAVGTDLQARHLESLLLDLELTALNLLRHRRCVHAAAELRRACQRSKVYRELLEAQRNVARQAEDIPQPPAGHPAAEPGPPPGDAAEPAAPRLPYKD